jgi:hypothetical protein
MSPQELEVDIPVFVGREWAEHKDPLSEALLWKFSLFSWGVGFLLARMPLQRHNCT